MDARDRIQKEYDEAIKELDNLGKPPEPGTDEGQNQDPALQQQGGEPYQQAPDSTGELETLKSQLATATAELNRLKSQFDDENSQTFKARYQTAQGIAKAAGEELKALRSEIAELKAQYAKGANSEPAELPKKLVEDLGEDAARLVIELKSKIDSLEAANGELRNQITTTGKTAEELKAAQAHTSANTFFSTLSTMVPDWKQLNGWGDTPGDSKFMAFLDEKPSDLLDETYDDLLKRYSQTGQVEKVAAIFKKFKDRNQSSPPPSLDKHIDGGTTGRGAPPPQPKDKQTYSLKDIEKFDRDIMTGKLDPHRDPKVKAKWDEYQMAIAEGRVR